MLGRSDQNSRHWLNSVIQIDRPMLTDAQRLDAAPAAVECRGLVKRYGDLVAVDGLSLTVARGECVGLLGPNGAGKTTTIEILEGLLDADAGDIGILGLGWHTHERELRQRLGVQLQETQLAEKLTVGETLRLFRSFYHRGPSIDALAGLVELDAKREDVGGPALGRTAATPGAGMRARRRARSAVSGRAHDRPGSTVAPSALGTAGQVSRGRAARLS